MTTNNDLSLQTHLNTVTETRISTKKVLLSTFGLCALTTIVLAGNISYAEIIANESADTPDDEFYSEDVGEYDVLGDNNCNVLGLAIYDFVGIQGEANTADYFRDTLQAYASDERVKAILVDVDSTGGYPTAGDEIKTYLGTQAVPVVANVRGQAGSAAYMAILETDHIIAGRYSDTGSIGAIVTYYDYSGYNKKEGIKYQPIKTGPHKDIVSQDRPMTAAEREIIQDDLDYIHENFVKDVSLYRNISIEKVRELADGNTYIAPKALEYGLIDEIGGPREVEAYLKNLIGEEPVVCYF